MYGCAKGIAFGGNNSFYKIDCDQSIKSYNRNLGIWETLGSRKTVNATNIAADSKGNVYLIDEGKIIGWTGFSWERVQYWAGTQFLAAGQKLYVVKGG